MISFLARAPRPRRQVQARLNTEQRCPICQGTEATYAFAHRQTRVSHCTGCELIRLDRRASHPGRMDDLLEPKAPLGDSGFKRSVDLPSLLQGALDILVSRLGNPPASIRLACVGVSASDVERVAGTLGVSVAVTELTDVISGNPFDAPPFAGDRDLPVYDACLLAVPVETLSEPVKVLHAIHRMLTPDGVLIAYLESLIPARYSLQSRQLRYSPEAAYVYNEETACSLLFGAGYGQIDFKWRQGDRGQFAWSSDRPRGSQEPALIVGSKRYADDPARHRNKLSVIMPVFNEKATFSKVFEILYAKQVPGLEREIIIVESNSTDGTREDVVAVSNQPGVTLLLEERPQGKGHAVRRGLEQATGDFIIIQDADLEYDIDDYDVLIEPLMANRATFVLGVRHGREGESWKVRHYSDQWMVTFVFNFAHLLFNLMFNVVYAQKLTDPFTMFKVFRRDCITGLKFECNRFDFDWELVAKLVRRGYIPVEIPVNYISRAFSAGKKVNPFSDPITWLRACIKYRFVKV